MNMFRPNIERMAAYVPGAQPPAGAKVVKLNTNENPYPPSPRMAEALRAFDADRLRLYPDAMATDFRRAAAEAVDVPPEWILPGNGSDDLIVLTCRAAADSTRPIAYPAPTFTFYETQGLVQDAGPVEVPFDEEYALPVDALAEANAAVTFLANPNSPSGTMAGIDELRELAGRLSGLLVIDEAYVDFAESDALPLVRERENVVVLRTLSKGYSLAGLRVGFAVAQPAVLEGLSKTKQIYNVGALPAALAAASMRDQEWKNANAERIRASRADLTAGLEQLGWRVWPSQANFVLARPPSGNAGEVHDALQRRGILVRHFDTPRLADKLRITVGTPEENAALMEAVGD